MKERQPVEVFSLAEFLCDEMDARHWTTDDVAARMDDDAKVFENAMVIGLLISVVDPEMTIEDEIFRNLARAFSVSEGLFRNLDAAWRKWPDRVAPFAAPSHLFGPIVKGALTNLANDNATPS